MKAHRLLRFLPLLAIAGAAADTFELKDGTKIEGTILKEDGSDYIIMVQVTKSIRDERRIPKADIVNTIAEKKDETDFAEIAKLVPAPDLQSEATYQAQIAKVESFIKKYPNSPKKTGALKIHDTLDDELTAIKSGGVKLGGKLISAAQRLPKAYALDAGIHAAKVKEAGDRGDNTTALREWALLETGFNGSTAYRETIPYTVALMKSHLAAVTSSLAGFEARAKARAAGLAAMSSSDRNRSQEALREEEAAYMAVLEKEKAANIKWRSLNPNVKAPMDETKRQLETEIRRLETLNTDQLPKSEKAYEEAYAAVVKATNKQELDAALSKARSASLPQPYLDQLAKLSKVAPAP